MKNIETKSKGLQWLLQKFQGEHIATLVLLSPDRTFNSYLLDEMIRQVVEKLNGEVRFEEIMDPMATNIKNELQINKNPLLLLIRFGRIEAIHKGVFGSQVLIESIRCIYNEQHKKTA